MRTPLWFLPALGLALGLASGLVETAIQFGRLRFLDASALGALQMNHEAVWTITGANALMLGLGGLLLSPLALFVRRPWVPRVGLAILAMPAFLTLVLTVRGITFNGAALLAMGMAATLARRVGFESPRSRRVVGWGLVPLGLAFGGLVAGHHWYEDWNERRAISALPAPRAESPNVLLIVLDTVRADALGCSGYGRDTTPNLDRLAARGVRFEQAYAPGAWTLPSHASLFTGRWPHELSARQNRPLDATYPTIAEHLGRHGYATAGFVANTYFCNAWYGLARGFLHYADTVVSARTLLGSSSLGRRAARHLDTGPNERPDAHFPRKDAATINGEFLGWLDGREAGRPFFVFLNYFDAHDPYLLEREPERPFGRRPRSAEELRMLRRWHLEGSGVHSEADLELARDCYDDCLAELDRRLGDLFAEMEQRGLDRNTWIVITADHGEQFGDHGIEGHGSSLYRACVHVPLLVVPPKGHEAPGQAVVEGPVSLRDVAATVCEVTDTAIDSKFPGRSLSRYWAASTGSEPVEAWAYSEIVDIPPGASASWQSPKLLVADGYSYIRQADGREELYHLVSDPEQIRDLAGTDEGKAVVERMRERAAGME